jgi:hypothetical protein
MYKFTIMTNMHATSHQSRISFKDFFSQQVITIMKQKYAHITQVIYMEKVPFHYFFLIKLTFHMHFRGSQEQRDYNLPTPTPTFTLHMSKQNQNALILSSSLFK